MFDFLQTDWMFLLLPCNIGKLGNRSGYQLWEQKDISSILQIIPQRCCFLLIDIQHIGKHGKSIKADSKRKRQSCILKYTQ